MHVGAISDAVAYPAAYPRHSGLSQTRAAAGSVDFLHPFIFFSLPTKRGRTTFISIDSDTPTLTPTERDMNAKTHTTPDQRYVEIFQHRESGYIAAVLCSIHASHNYEVGLGETYADALSDFTDTPIQCCDPMLDALDWVLNEEADVDASDFKHIGTWDDDAQAPVSDDD